MKALTSVNPPKRAWYKFEGVIPVTVPRNLAAGYGPEDDHHVRMLNTFALEHPEAAETIQLQPNQEYLLHLDEFPGLMSPARAKKLGRLVHLPDKEVPTYPGTVKAEPKAVTKPAVKAKAPEPVPSPAKKTTPKKEADK